MKLMVIFGTRPEVIKLAPVISEARRNADDVELLVCSTGQHREMLDQTMAVFGISPDIKLAVMRDNQSLPELTARLIESLADVIAEHRSDVVIVQGDTTSAFAAALAAFYNHIPVAHVEAGLRTGNLNSPFPEELNRVMIGRIAHWHFAPTQRAEQNLIHEGVDDSSIVVTGNTVVDTVQMIRITWENEETKDQFTSYFPGRELVLITAHRRESFGRGLQQICMAIRTLCSSYPKLGFVFPVHLNPQVRTVVHELLAGLDNLQLIEPVDFQTSLYLQSQARLIITDSGGIQEEAPSFAVPTVVVREHTERSEGVEAGFATLAGTEANAIVQVAESYLQDTEIRQRLRNSANPYGDGLACQRIIATLLGESVEAFHG